MMRLLAGAALTALLAALSLIHVGWAIRRVPEGVIPMRNGRPIFKPGAPATLVVALCLALSAWLVFRLDSSTHIPPARWIKISNAGVALVFSMRAVGDFRYCGLFKRHRGTLFAVRDTRFYTPLCMMIAATLGWLLVTQPND